MKIYIYLTIFLLLTITAFGATCPKVDYSCDGEYKIHLTFDDGPHKNTNRLLWILKQNNVKASFYPLGRKLVDKKGKKLKNSEKNFELLDKMVREGHVVGTHTYVHLHHNDHLNNTPKDSEKRILANRNISWEDSFSIVENSTVLDKYYKKAGGIYYRLPYGQGWFESQTSGDQARDTRIMESLLSGDSKRDSYHVGWNIDSEDWTYEDEPQNATTDLKFLKGLKKSICQRKGGVALFHDHTGMTSRNLSCFIKNAKKAGHQFVGLEETKQMNNAGPKLVMDINDVYEAKGKNCSTPNSKSDMQINSEAFDKFIMGFVNQKQYEPNELKVKHGNIYNQKTSDGKSKYDHIGTYQSFKTVYSLTRSEEFQDFLRDNDLDERDLYYFENNVNGKNSIQIGTLK